MSKSTSRLSLDFVSRSRVSLEHCGKLYAAAVKYQKYYGDTALVGSTEAPTDYDRILAVLKTAYDKAAKAFIKKQEDEELKKKLATRMAEADYLKDRDNILAPLADVFSLCFKAMSAKSIKKAIAHAFKIRLHITSGYGKYVGLSRKGILDTKGRNNVCANIIETIAEDFGDRNSVSKLNEKPNNHLSKYYDWQRYYNNSNVKGR